VLLGSAVVGVAIFNQTQQRVTARLLGLGAGGLWLLAILGIAWEPLGRIGAAELMVPALWFAALPAAHAWLRCWRLTAYLLGSPARAAVLLCVALAGVAVAGREVPERIARQCQETPRLTLGLSAERQELVAALRKHTTAEGRILGEDRHCRGDASRWTALLPLWTGRSFVGGLMPNGDIEHAAA